MVRFSSLIWMMMISDTRQSSSLSLLMKEKRSNVTYLVQAKSLARALRYIDEVMGKTMIDYDIVGLNETKIFDVFEHHAPSSENKEEKNE